MTSSRKRTRRRRTGLPIRRIAVMALGIAAFGAALFAWFNLTPDRLDPAASKEATARSVALMQADNASSARDAAVAAVRADPNNGQAHVALANTMLAMGEGLGAEAQLRRAGELGIDAKLLAHLRAHALLLQGDTDKAIALADTSAPQFRGYGLRIRARALTGLGNYTGALAALDEAVRIAGNDADVWVDVGRFKTAAGDVRGAILASERAVKLDAGNIDALVLRGELVRTQYGLVAALPWFEAALKRDGEHRDALVEYASTLGDAGRTVQSLAVTRRLMEVRQGDPRGYYLQAVIAARGGDTDLARGLIEKTGGTIDAIPGGLLLASSLDIEAGDYEQAIQKLQPLVGNQPMNLTARKLLAVSLLRTDAARNAIDVVRPITDRADADSYTLTLAARGYERIGDRAAAAKLLDRAASPAVGAAAAFSADDSTAVLSADAANSPGDPQAIMPLIRALVDNGDRAGALAKAEEIAARNNGAPAAHVAVGDMLMLMERYGDASAAYQRAASLRFDEPTMLRLVEAFDRAGQRQQAANTLALFLSQNPVNIAALRLSAHWQLAASEYDDAIDTLERLRARVGDGDAALNAELATAYAGAGETALATELGEAAYALAPSNPAVADAFGWALFKSGDLPGALELLQKAVTLAPRHPGLRWHLAQVYAELDRKPEARQQAQAALADPSFGDRNAAGALVASLG